MILGRTLEYSRFVIESFCPERPVIFDEAPKHTMDEFFKGTKKVEVVGDSHLYQSPLIICLIRQHLSSLQNWWLVQLILVCDCFDVRP